MASVRVILKEEKVNKAGEAPVYLRIIKDRKPTYVSLSLRVKPQDWNSDTGRVKRSHPNMARTNAYISQRMAQAEDVALKLQTESKFVAPVKIKQTIMGRSSASFLKYFADYLAILEKGGKVNTLRRATSIYTKLRAFLGSRDLLFEEVTVYFLKQYETHLRDEVGNSTNTIHSNLKMLRKLFKDAIREDLVSPAQDPFIRFKLKLEKTTKHFLLEEELEALRLLPLKEDTTICHHRNLFVFASDAGGVRISDLLLLKWANFSGTHIQFTIQKTNDVVSIKVPPRALELLAIYRTTTSKPVDYIFPFLQPEHHSSDPWTLQKAIASATAHANRNLKILAKRAGIDKPISFHSSRHTFATRALSKGVKIEYVSKLLGHNSIKTTQIYAKIVDEQLDRAMDVFN